MALEEGLNRVRLVGKTVLGIGLFFAAVSLVGCLWATDYRESALLTLGPIAIYLSALGALILLGAWIAEGFAQPRQPPRP